MMHDSDSLYDTQCHECPVMSKSKGLTWKGELSKQSKQARAIQAVKDSLAFYYKCY